MRTTTMSEVEKLFKDVGSFGRYQIRAFVIVNGLEFWAAMAMLLPVFTGAKPYMFCSDADTNQTVPGIKTENITDVCLMNDTVCAGLSFSQEFTSIISEVGPRSLYPAFLTAISILISFKTSAPDLNHAIYSPTLQRFKTQTGDILIQENVLTRAPKTVLPLQWSRFGKTVRDNALNNFLIMFQWTLLCNLSYVSDLITTIQMVGVLLGAFLAGQIADLFGRRKVLFGIYSLMITIGFLSAFANSWPVYATVRFFLGIMIGGLMVVSFVLPIELVSPKWRTLCGCIGFWGVGVACLAFLAYLVRDWRQLTMISTAPGLLMLLTWWWVPESPRWLVLQGRVEEAKSVLAIIAKFNKRDKPDFKFLASYAQAERERQEMNRKYSYWHLFKTWRLAKITLIAMYSWFACNSVYYGINLNMKNLSGDRYINMFLSGIVEIPALLFVVFINNRIGRRWTVSALLFLGSLAMFAILVMDLVGQLDSLPDVTTAVVLIGKSAVSAGWGALMVFSAESFPTVARNLGVGACAVAGRLGGILAPQIVFLDEIWTPLPFVICGSFGVVCAILILFLPETNKMPLPETFKSEHEVSFQEESVMEETVNTHL